MKKKVIIVNSSLRNNSNSEILAKEFKRGAEANNDVELINLKDINFSFCKGCLACQKTGKCVIEDDMKSIEKKVEEADILVIASPIYYLTLSGQTKVFLDRMNPMFINNFNLKDIYLITSSAENGHEMYDNAINDMEGWISCFNGITLRKHIHVSGVTYPKEVEKMQDKLREIYNIGLEI